MFVAKFGVLGIQDIDSEIFASYLRFELIRIIILLHVSLLSLPPIGHCVIYYMIRISEQLMSFIQSSDTVLQT